MTEPTVSLPHLIETMKRMRALGDKFLARAESEPNIKIARLAFDMANRAYDFAYDERKLRAAFNFQLISGSCSKSEIDSDYFLTTTLFFDRLFEKGRILKAAAYRKYVEHCKVISVEPVNKREFYTLMQERGIKTRCYNGNSTLLPPDPE